jgi:hypothetical protein
MKTVLLMLLSSAALAEVNMEKYELSGEYGLAYHSLVGEQKSNGTKGCLTSAQYPYWIGSLTTRFAQSWGLRLFFEVTKAKFAQGGISFTLHQRRRLGLLWGLGVKGYALLPVDGGDITTEAGAGSEGFARLGWLGPFGTSYLLKGF